MIEIRLAKYLKSPNEMIVQKVDVKISESAALAASSCFLVEISCTRYDDLWAEQPPQQLRFRLVSVNEAW